MTSEAWPSSERNNAPLATSQRRTVLSPEPDARRAPSGEKVAANTMAEWPSSVRVSLPVAASHNVTVLSHEPIANAAPSGEKTTVITQSAWPSIEREELARRGLPHGGHLYIYALETA